MNAAKEEFLTVSEVAARLRFSVGFVYKLIRKGAIPAIDFSGTKRVPRTALEKVLAAQIEPMAR